MRLRAWLAGKAGGGGAATHSSQWCAQVPEIVEVAVPIEKLVEKRVPYPVEQIVEKLVPVPVDQIVEKIVYVPKKVVQRVAVEVPVPVEKIIEKDVPFPGDYCAAFLFQNKQVDTLLYPLHWLCR